MLGELLAVAMRHLGGAVQLQNIARGVVARDRAARFQRHAGMAADGKIKLDDGMRGAKRRVNVAIGLLDDHRLGREPAVEFAERRIDRHHRRQFFEIEPHLVGRVLGPIGIIRKHHR